MGKNALMKMDEKEETTFDFHVLKLIKRLDSGKVKPKELTSHQRRVVVKYFLEERSDVSDLKIGELIGVTGQAVRWIKRKLIDEAFWQIEELDIKRLATSLLRKRNEFQRRAAGDKDWRLAWQIELDYIKAMTDLGFIARTPIPFKLEEEYVIRVVYVDKDGAETIEEVKPDGTIIQGKELIKALEQAN